MVDIIIPIWNQPELTARCLESLARAGEPETRLILVDNGSGQPTRDLLEAARKGEPSAVQVIRNEENLGFIKAANQGIRAARSEWVCLLNNDTVVTRGWLTEMLKVARSGPKAGLVNPTSNSLGFHPAKGQGVEEYAASLSSRSGAAAELATALGFCLLAPRALFGETGLLDESYGMGNFDDDDLSRRVRAAGYRCLRACAAYVHHEEKASFRHLPGWEKDFEENKRAFQKKWGRPLRILWETPPAAADGNEGAPQTALALVREGHWICFVHPEREPPGEILALAQVHRLPTAPRAWRLRAAARLVAKRKKPFDLVICYDRAWSRWVRRLRTLHRAVLLDSPTDKEVLEQCQAMSRSPS